MGLGTEQCESSLLFPSFLQVHRLDRQRPNFLGLDHHSPITIVSISWPTLNVPIYYFANAPHKRTNSFEGDSRNGLHGLARWWHDDAVP